MERSEKLDQLADALFHAQHAFKPAKLNAVDRDGKRYADLASIWRAARGPLRRNHLAVVQWAGPNEIATMLVHISGQYICGTVACTEEGWGRRHALMAVLGIVQESAPDAADTRADDITAERVIAENRRRSELREAQLRA